MVSPEVASVVMTAEAQPPHYRIESGGLDDETACLMFEAWVQRLSTNRLDLSARSSGGSPGGVDRTATFGDLASEHFVLNISGLDITDVTSVEVSRDEIQSILEDASAKVAARDTGEPVVYPVEMRVPPVDFTSVHFMRILGDQVHIEGNRRLADIAILEFEEGLLADAPPEGLMFAPPSTVQVTIFAPGPVHSDLTQKVAAGISEMVAAVCAFATGRAVEYFPPMFPHPDEDAAASALARRTDPAILTLARDSISLDVFGELPALGDLDAVLRVRGALIAYHAALKQTIPDVAVMLLVTSIEALISPRPEWENRR